MREGDEGVAERGGDSEDARLGLLTDDLGELERSEMERVGGGEKLDIESGADVATDRRELGPIAHEEEAAMAAGGDIGHQVVEERALRRKGAVGGVVETNHRDLVDDEECIAMFVGGEGAMEEAVFIDSRAIDFFMDGKGRGVGIGREDLGGAAGRCEELCTDMEIRGSGDEGRDERRLARAGIAHQQESGKRVGVVEETDEVLTAELLTLSRGMREKREDETLDAKVGGERVVHDRRW